MILFGAKWQLRIYKLIPCGFDTGLLLGTINFHLEFSYLIKNNMYVFLGDIFFPGIRFKTLFKFQVTILLVDDFLSLDVFFLKSFTVLLMKIILLQNLSQGRGTGRRMSETESLSNVESRNMRRPSSSSVAGGLPPLIRCWANSNF